MEKLKINHTDISNVFIQWTLKKETIMRLVKAVNVDKDKESCFQSNSIPAKAQTNTQMLSNILLQLDQHSIISKSPINTNSQEG